MARIKTYVTDGTVSEYDVVIGSDAENLSVTKNYTMGAIQRFVKSGLTPIDGGTLNIREITYTGGTYSTPYAYLNSLDPNVTILQYDIVIVNINSTKYILKKQNILVGIDQTPLVSSDFILIKEPQVQSDWNATSGPSLILNKPSTTSINLQQVLDAGNGALDKTIVLTSGTGVFATIGQYEIVFTHPGANTVFKYQSNGIFGFNSTGNYTGLQLPTNGTNNLTFSTPIKTSGTYTLATTVDVPFEKIDEGNGFGYIIRGRDASFYGNVGEDAIDLSYSDTSSSAYGATGSSAFAAGINVIASGFLSASFGYLIDNNGNGSFNAGYNLKDRGYTNFLTGIGHDVTSMNVTVVGQAALVINEQISDFNATTTKAVFVVGNGTITNADPNYTVLTRSNALVVRLNGSVEAPSLTKSLITADTTGKILVTKEYLNLQKIITYPADFTGTDYTITSADMGYSIIIVNGATAVTITVPTALVSKMQVGFIQDGTGDVTITPSSTTLKNAISGYKIKGQYDQVFLEQGSTTSVYYLLGNTKV